MSVQQLGFDVSVPSACTATAGTASGNLDTSANYSYKITFVTGFGETSGGSAAAVTTTSTGSVDLTAIPVSTNLNVKSRNIYRTTGGGTSYALLAALSNNTATTYADIKADGDLGAAMPTLNSAGSQQYVLGTFKISNLPIGSVTSGITALAGGAQSGATALTASVNVIDTVATTNDSVILPEMSTALIGTRIIVRNNGANTCRIYPYSGQVINALSADAPITLATVTTMSFVCDAAATWKSY